MHHHELVLLMASSHWETLGDRTGPFRVRAPRRLAPDPVESVALPPDASPTSAPPTWSWREQRAMVKWLAMVGFDAS